MSLIKEPIMIKGRKISSRVVMPPMATAKSTLDGYVTEDLCRYYEDRTAGGYLGIVITEHSYITQQGKAGNGQMSLADDNAVEGLKQLTETIHKGCGFVVAQLNHAGSSTSMDITGMPIVSASAVENPGKKAGLPVAIPEELSKEEIQKIQEEFVNAAVRAKKAGYDAVEIHSAHGYLLNQFFSPLTNKRSDEYGPQSIENRTRFQVEVYRKIREAVGNDYPVFIRLGGCDYLPGGSTIEDAVEASLIFEKEGIDIIDLTGGMCRYERPDNKEPGYFSDMSAEVKKAVKVPVLVTGGITTAQQAEEILKENRADLVGVGRAILKDPAWAEKYLGEN